MTDRPIIFFAPMVRALLAGTKTQTRRVLKPQPYIDDMGNAICGKWNYGQGANGKPHLDHIVANRCKGRGFRCMPGDRLWVRERFSQAQDPKWLVAYRADGAAGAWGWNEDGKPIFLKHGTVLEGDGPGGDYGFSRYGGRWRPSIHMPRRLSRLTLAVTDVRMQRLQDISEEDARAEGIYWGGFDGWTSGRVDDASDFHQCLASRSFEGLWCSLHGPDAWEENPWVAAISFTVECQNIDRASRP